MQTAVEIFQFEDPVAFLNAQLREKQKKDPRFSLRAWARQLGYENPSLLFHILKGERRLKMDLALKMAATLNLKGKSLRYFELLVLKSVSQTETEKRMFQAMMAKLHPQKDTTVSELSMDIYAVASEWYHWVIYTMISLADFRPDIAWIQERIGGELDKKTVTQAIDRLLLLRLIEKSPEGTLSAADQKGWLFVPNEVPSPAIRSYHSQMIDKAKASIEQQTMDERQLRGTTIAFRKEDMEKATQIIADAHAKIMELGVTDDADEVYQYSTQFFRLTRKKSERSH